MDDVMRAAAERADEGIVILTTFSCAQVSICMSLGKCLFSLVHIFDWVNWRLFDIELYEIFIFLNISPLFALI